MISHIISDTSTVINIDSYKTNQRYYGGRHINLYLLDFNIGELRNTMLSNNLYRMFLYLGRSSAAASMIDYFFIKKIDLNTGEGGGVSGGGGGGVA